MTAPAASGSTMPHEARNERREEVGLWRVTSDSTADRRSWDTMCRGLDVDSEEEDEVVGVEGRVLLADAIAARIRRTDGSAEEESAIETGPTLLELLPNPSDIPGCGLSSACATAPSGEEDLCASKRTSWSRVASSWLICFWRLYRCWAVACRWDGWRSGGWICS
jgi:hypothetical protein